MNCVQTGVVRINVIDHRIVAPIFGRFLSNSSHSNEVELLLVTRDVFANHGPGNEDLTSSLGSGDRNSFCEIECFPDYTMSLCFPIGVAVLVALIPSLCSRIVRGGRVAGMGET